MRLTDEQQKAVEAPLDAPVLVIAGAGSGKTELMSIRVLWLIANSLALPQDILGLTFTRKAASELAKRIKSIEPAGEQKFLRSNFIGGIKELLKSQG